MQIKKEQINCIEYNIEYIEFFSLVLLYYITDKVDNFTLRKNEKKE